MPVNRIQRVSSSADIKFPPKRQNSMPLAYDETTDQLITMNELGQVTAIQTLNPYIASENILKYEYGTITNAELKALAATPKTLVAAVAGGKVIQFVSLALFMDYGSNVLTVNAADNLVVRYIDGTGVIVSQVIETDGFLTLNTDAYSNGLAKIDAIATKAQCDGKAIVLHNVGVEIAGNAGADTIVRYKCVYRVHSAGW